MSAIRYEDRASLRSFTLDDGRRCRTPRRHDPCGHAGKSANPVRSMAYFILLWIPGGGGRATEESARRRTNFRQIAMPLNALEATLTNQHGNR